jgi:hypothetical protein
MNSIYLTLFSLFFLSQSTLWANEPIEAEDIITEDVIQEDVIQKEIIPKEVIHEENIPEEAIMEEPTNEALLEQEAPVVENAEPMAEPMAKQMGEPNAEPMAEPMAKQMGEPKVDPNAPTADELEAAQAEEAELREVGAGEEPIAE